MPKVLLLLSLLCITAIPICRGWMRGRVGFLGRPGTFGRYGRYGRSGSWGDWQEEGQLGLDGDYDDADDYYVPVRDQLDEIMVQRKMRIKVGLRI